MRRHIHSHARQARIGVIGVGGSGRQSVSHLLKNNFYHADFILIDTDHECLFEGLPDESQIFDRILLADQRNTDSRSNRGTNGNVAMGEWAAEGSVNRIQAAIQNFDLLILIGGMGGGTATAALPIIARKAAQLDILTVAIVTTPFGFERNKRHQVALKGVNALNSLVDTLIVIHGDQLLEQIENRINLHQALALADDLCHRSLHIIEQLTQYRGIVNLDFADLQNVLEGNGTALMTTGIGRGEDRVAQAVENALTCPLLNRTAVGAHHALICIVTPPDQDFFAVMEISESITAAIGEQADVKWGVMEDTCLHDEIHIMLVATGFCEITQIAHITSDPMRDAKRKNKQAENSLSDHFWAI